MSVSYAHDVRIFSDAPRSGPPPAAAPRSQASDHRGKPAAGSPGPGACRKKRSDGESSAQRSAPRRIRGGDALPGGQTPPNRGPATDRPAVLSPCRCRPACSSGRPRTGLRGLAPRSLFLSVPLSRPRVPSCLHRYSRPTIAPPSPFHGPLSSARGHTRQQLLRQSDLDAGPHARLGCTHYTSSKSTGACSGHCPNRSAVSQGASARASAAINHRPDVATVSAQSRRRAVMGVYV